MTTVINRLKRDRSLPEALAYVALNLDCTNAQ